MTTQNPLNASMPIGVGIHESKHDDISMSQEIALYDEEHGKSATQPSDSIGTDNFFHRPTNNNSNNNNNKSEQDQSSFLQKLWDKNFYLSCPWSPMVYFSSTRGGENFHIYLWIAKDLCWTQNLDAASVWFGAAALIWCGVLFIHSLRRRNYEDIYMLVPTTVWLLGNYIWMLKEVTQDDDSVGAFEASTMFEAALVWILVYHVILRPLGFFPINERHARRYEEMGLKCRFSYFKTWRQYEHAHTLFWLGKDYSWNMSTQGFAFQAPWVIFVIPTFIVAIDFIYSTIETENAIDCAHYIAQFLWVCANIVWAGGEVFYSPFDNPYNIFHVSHNAKLTARWYSSWILLFSYLPIVILYAVWLPLTLMGRLDGCTDDDVSVESDEMHPQKKVVPAE